MADLTLKQEKAIVALLSERTITTAAEKAGVGERTLYRWLEEAAFNEAYRQARRKAVHQATARLQHVSWAAVTVLSQVMADKRTPPSTRVAAAKTVLAFAIKAVGLEDIEARLAALEQQ